MKPSLPRIERLRSAGPRNMVAGIAACLVGLVLLGASLVLAGPGLSFVALSTALLIMGMLWILSALGIPAQPNGFIAVIGITAATSLLVPLLVGVVKSTVPPASRGRVAPMPRVQIAPDPSPRDTLPLLAESFPVDAPDIESEAWVEVVQNSKIMVKDRQYRIRQGERFALRRIDGDEAIFKTRNFLVSLPLRAVEVHYPSSTEAPAVEAATPEATPKAGAETAATPARSPLEITREAQAKAMERYPALTIKDSRENAAYVAAYLDLKRTNPEFFDDPEWPLQLAEAVAERDGWNREDLRP